MAGVGFRLDAQVIMSGRDAGHDYRVASAAFGPGAVAVAAGIVADFAAEVPGLAGVLVDQRIVQVDPTVGDVGRGFDFYVGGASF